MNIIKQHCWLFLCLNRAKLYPDAQTKSQGALNSPFSLSPAICFGSSWHHFSTPIPFLWLDLLPCLSHIVEYMFPTSSKIIWFLQLGPQKEREFINSEKNGCWIRLLEKDPTLFSVETEFQNICLWSCDQFGTVEPWEKHLQNHLGKADLRTEENNLSHVFIYYN